MSVDPQHQNTEEERIMNTGNIRLSILLALAVTLSLGLAPSPAQANPACGSTVSGLVVFDSNLACSGNGLTVGADNTTIDLAGFTLSCTGGGYLGSCQSLGCTGINTAGHSDVLIHGGGTITGYTIGVLVNGGSNVNVRDLTVTGPASPGAGSNPRPAATGIAVTGTICPSPPDTIINVHGNDVSNHREGIELVHIPPDLVVDGSPHRMRAAHPLISR